MSFGEPTADISVPSENVRGERRGPPVEMCEQVDAGRSRPTIGMQPLCALFSRKVTAKTQEIPALSP